MRYNKNRTILIAVIALLVLLLVGLVIVALAGLGNNGPTRTPGTTTAPTDPSQTAEDLVIETPYRDLVFPGEYAAFLKVERTENPDLVLDFYATFDSGKSQKLYSIGFGEPIEPAIGQIATADGVVVGVYVASYEFEPDGTWPVREANTVTAMQETMSVVLEGMKIVDLDTPMPEVQGDEVVIETPHAKLYMPGKWAEELTVTIDQTDGYELIFHGTINEHEPMALFAVSFGGSEGTVVHTLYTENDVAYDVRLRTFPLEMEGWSSVDQATARAMQEDLNYLLGKLREE